jgi:hypothetical protein
MQLLHLTIENLRSIQRLDIAASVPDDKLELGDWKSHGE